MQILNVLRSQTTPQHLNDINLNVSLVCFNVTIFIYIQIKAKSHFGFFNLKNKAKSITEEHATADNAKPKVKIQSLTSNP